MFVEASERSPAPATTQKGRNLREISTEPSQLLALVAGGNSDEPEWEVDWLILSWPADQLRLNVAVHAPDGARVWAGVGAPDWPSTGISLGTLPGHRHPIVSLTIRVTNGRLSMVDLRARDQEPGSPKRRPIRE
jgi:hypothetical protein